MSWPKLHADVLAIDCAAETERTTRRMRDFVGGEMHRRGAVVALSGGVDSAVCAALAVRAFGPGRVHALMLPERDSPADGLSRAAELAAQLGISHEVLDITAALEALNCYRARDQAIAALFPDYGPGWKSKIAIAGGAAGGYRYFNLIVQSPAGDRLQQRMGAREYLQVVAATNLKQRVRKTVEYYHADRLHYCVVGTPNRLEYDQGFFVKNGDGAADLKPIAHLYKSQVYALGRHLGVPAGILDAVPSTDTYSLAQGQDEFYFVLPYAQMDLALWAFNHGRPAAELAQCLGLPESRAASVYADIAAKRRATEYQHAPAMLVEPVRGSSG